jgi:hypothetical protein
LVLEEIKEALGMANWEKQLVDAVKDIDTDVKSGLTAMQTIASNTTQLVTQNTQALTILAAMAADLKLIREQGQDEVVGIEVTPGTPTTNK